MLDDRRIYELVPLERLVIDEASQIDVGEFMVGRFRLIVVTSHLICALAPLPQVQQTAESMFLRRSETTSVLFLSFRTVSSSSIAVPPYGRDTIKSLQSLFEIKHLRRQAHFLNTQCDTRHYLPDHSLLNFT